MKFNIANVFEQSYYLSTCIRNKEFIPTEEEIETIEYGLRKVILNPLQQAILQEAFYREKSKRIQKKSDWKSSSQRFKQKQASIKYMKANPTDANEEVFEDIQLVLKVIQKVIDRR